MPVPKGYKRPITIGRIEGETEAVESRGVDEHRELVDAIRLSLKLRNTVVVRLDGNDIVFEARPS